MIISDEQARLAVRDIGSTHSFRPCRPASAGTVSEELLAKARAVALEAPDIRPGRVADARARMGSGPLDSRDIAGKMISRLVCDYLP